MPAKLRCLLLCEDLEQEQLFRPILERLFHRVRVEPRRPNGGFTFVLSRLKQAAQYVRQRPQEAVGLLVAVDGDLSGFHTRLEEIEKVVREAGFASRPDRIAICIPTRNVETWELWLCGVSDLDERTDYKLRFHRDFKPGLRPGQLADQWFTTSAERQKAEAGVLPALAHGRAEVTRLRKVTKD